MHINMYRKTIITLTEKYVKLEIVARHIVTCGRPMFRQSFRVVIMWP